MNTFKKNTFRNLVMTTGNEKDLKAMIKSSKYLDLKILGDYEETSKLYDEYHNEIWQILNGGFCPSENFKHLLVCNAARTVAVQEQDKYEEKDNRTTRKETKS